MSGPMLLQDCTAELSCLQHAQVRHASVGQQSVNRGLCPLLAGCNIHCSLLKLASVWSAVPMLPDTDRKGSMFNCAMDAS